MSRPVMSTLPAGSNRAPSFDAESGAALAAMRPREEWSTTEEFISMMRGTTAFDATDEELGRGSAVDVSEHVVRSFDGVDISLVVCRPYAAAATHPALYFVHGGGMVSGTPRTGLLEVVQLADHLDAVVVSVGYRLPPENPDPIPVEDCYAGLLATFQRCADFGIDRERVVLVGSSAGGGLAAGIALLARDRRGPVPAGLMLMNPMLDDRNDSFSSHQMAHVDNWDREANKTGWASLLGERSDSDVPAYSAPGRATNLSGLPPAFLDVGSAETLRDETVAFANGIWQAGGAAELHVWPGGFHGYEFVAPHSRLAHVTWSTRLGWLRRMVAE